VFGQSFWPAALERIMTSQDAQMPTAELLELLLDRDWLTLARNARFSGRTELSFRHALIREAAYDLLDEGERQLTHRAAAEWLEEAGERDAAVLAEHWEKGGELARASVCFTRAAQQALEGNDLDGTLALGERAVACGAEDLTLAEVRLLQAEAHNWRGAHDHAIVLCQEAIGRFEQHRADENHSGHWAHSVEQLSWGYFYTCRHIEVERLGSQLLRDLPSNMNGAVALALGQIARHNIFAGHLRTARALIDILDARAAGRNHEDRAAAAILELAKGNLNLAQSRVGVGLQHCERAASYAVAIGNERLLFVIHGSLAGIHEGLGDYERAEQSALLAAEFESRSGARDPILVCNRGLIHLGLGQLVEAEAVLRSGLKVTVGSDDRLKQGYCRICLGRVLLALRRFGEAEAHARAVLAAEDVPLLQAYGSSVLARALIAQRRTAEAETAARRAFEVLEQGGIEDGEAFIRLTFAEALYANGDLPAARHAIRSAAEHLFARAADLDEELRQKFLTRVFENARTLRLAGDW
jgi:tetratricopeptide (TPR) repeat protein